MGFGRNGAPGDEPSTRPARPAWPRLKAARWHGPLVIAFCCLPASLSSDDSSLLFRFEDATVQASTRPYRFGDRPLDRYSEDLRAAMTRYPDVAACFEPPVGPVVGLEALRWDRFRNEDEVSVCVFHIAATLGTAERSARWLRSQGFATGQPIRNAITGSIDVSGSWKTTDGLKYRSAGWLSSVFGFFVYSQSVGLGWDRHGGLQRVSTGNNVL